MPALQHGALRGSETVVHAAVEYGSDADICVAERLAVEVGVLVSELVDEPGEDRGGLVLDLLDELFRECAGGALAPGYFAVAPVDRLLIPISVNWLFPCLESVGVEQ